MKTLLFGTGEGIAWYGKAVESKKDTAVFFKNGMTVAVHLIDGHVHEISYYKIGPKNSKKTICPSDAEMNILLRADAPDTPWDLELAQLGDTLWINREKGLSAFRTPKALTISIADPAAYKAFHEQKTAVRDLELLMPGRSCQTYVDRGLPLKF